MKDRRRIAQMRDPITATLKRAVLIAGSAGFAVACLLEGISYSLAPSTQLPAWCGNVVIWLWPTIILLMDTSENLEGFIVFMCAAIFNGMLYALLAFIVGYVVNVFRRDTAAV